MFYMFQTLVKGHASDCLDEYGSRKRRSQIILDESEEDLTQALTHWEDESDERGWMEVNLELVAHLNI